MPVTELDNKGLIGWAEYNTTRLGALQLPTVDNPGTVRIEGPTDNTSIRVSNLLGPVADSQLSTKGYVDDRTEGITVKAPCRVAASANVSVATLTPGTFVDEMELVLHDRVLLRHQAETVSNGIYVVTATGGERSDDFAVGALIRGAYTYVVEGGTTSTSADRGFFCPGVDGSPDASVGTAPVVWEQFSARTDMYAGSGLIPGFNNRLDVDPVYVPYLDSTLQWMGETNTFQGVEIGGNLHLSGTNIATGGERALVVDDTPQAPRNVVNWEHLYNRAQKMYWKRPVRTVVGDWSWSLVMINPTALGESTYLAPTQVTHNLDNTALFGFPLNVTSLAHDWPSNWRLDIGDVYQEGYGGLSSWDRVNLPALFDGHSGYTRLIRDGWGAAAPGGDTAALRRRIKAPVHNGSTAWIRSPFWKTGEKGTTTWQLDGNDMEYPYVRVNIDMGAKCLLRKFKWGIFDRGGYNDPVTFTVWGSNDPNFMADQAARVVKHDWIVNRETATSNAGPIGATFWSSGYGGGANCPSVTHEVENATKIWEVNSFQKVAGLYPWQSHVAYDVIMDPNHGEHWRRAENSVIFECDRMDPTRWKAFDGITGEKHDGHSIIHQHVHDVGAWEWANGDPVTDIHSASLLPGAWDARGGYANADEALYFRPHHRLTLADYYHSHPAGGTVNTDWNAQYSRSLMQWYPRTAPAESYAAYSGSSYPVTTPIPEQFQFYCMVTTIHNNRQYNPWDPSKPYTSLNPIEIFEFSPSVVSTGGKPQAGFLTKDAVVNGLSMRGGDRVLLNAQAEPETNGIYRVSHEVNGTPERTDDLTFGDSAHGVVVVATEGLKGRDVPWLCTNDVGSDLTGTDSLSFTAMAVSAVQLAGQGLSVDSLNQMQMATDGLTTETVGDKLQVRGGVDNCILGDKPNVFLAGTADTEGNIIPNTNTIGTPWVGGIKYQVDGDGNQVLQTTYDVDGNETGQEPVPVQDANGNDVQLNPLSIEDNPNFASASQTTGAVRIGIDGSSSGLGIQGHLHCNGVYNHSDERLKDDIQPINAALDTVLSLSGYAFEWRSNGKKDVGVSAQEVLQNAPLCVETGGDYLSVDYNKLVPYLVEGVKSLKRGIESLEDPACKSATRPKPGCK